MRLKRFYLPAIVVLILGFSFWKKQTQDSNSFDGHESEAQSLTSESHVQGNFLPSPTLQSEFQKKLQEEVQKISRPDEYPQSTEDHLRKFSEQLKDSEIQILYQTSLDQQKPQDERFLAVMLLGWTQKSQAAELLQKIATAEIDPQIGRDSKLDFEEILRMKAVEGIADLNLNPEVHEGYLHSIIDRSSNTQVTDRANRALWALHRQAEAPQKQDEDALNELLKKSAQ